MNIQPNVSILSELRQVHRQLIRTDIGQMYSLLETAMFREKWARRKFMNELNSMKRANENELDNVTALELGEMKKYREDSPLPEDLNLLEKEVKEEIVTDEEEEDEFINYEKNEDDERNEKIERNEEYGINAESPTNPLEEDDDDDRPKIDVKEWRKLYEDELAKKYGKHTRIRFLFCRKLYACYLEKLRQINRTPDELLTVNEKRFIKKFDLDGDVLTDRLSQKPYICYEDFFEVINNSHIKLELNEIKDIYNSLKDKYANITLLSVQIYWKIRYQLMKQQCYAKSSQFIANLQKQSGF